jgi:predicted RNase H-like HicB family nuclease
MPTIKDYATHIYWDERAGYFVAEIPEIPTCSADGNTAAEALANLEQTFAVMKEAYEEEKLTIPSPDPSRSISIDKLSALTPLVKVSQLAKFAGIPGQTLAAKLKRRTPFSVTEARRISRAFRDHGLAVR